MDELSLDKAEQIAAERNRKFAKKYPLYADQMIVTAEEVKRATDAHRAKFEETERILQARGEEFRLKVKELVTEIELASLDSRRLNLPRGPEYHADFWRHRYEERTKSGEGEKCS